MTKRRVCLVGAGAIAQTHAEALRNVPGVEIAAVVDPNRAAAEALARRHGARAWDSAAELLDKDRPGAAHVLVPPDLHGKVALPFVAAGVPVLVEKPLCASGEETRGLIAAAERAGAVLGVNQNFVFHPAFRRLAEAVARSGPLRAVDCLYNVPLRQMAARQFGHWMFRQPKNILLEQAVHPLSQIMALAGPFAELSLKAGPAQEIAPGVPFHATAAVTGTCGGSVPFQMQFGVGREYPFWQLTAICDDGVVVADMLANRCVVYGRTKWLEPVDTMLVGGGAGLRLLGDSLGNGANYVLSLLKLKPRSDPFYRSMHGSIADFHAALDAGRAPRSDGAFGLALIEACEAMAAEAFREAAPQPPAAGGGDYDVAVLGGTGFIGRHVVSRLLADGWRVGVMARNFANLAPVFSRPGVTLVRGDVRRAEDVARAVQPARLVVNLAHGGGGADFAAIRDAMVGSAALVAEACLANGIERLIHVGSIAGLYCGDPGAVVTGATPTDPRPEKRADYSRAKALADDALTTMARERGLPLCILRPGVVVGEGAPPFHTGVGFHNNDQHCLGWNDGRNPLPFVLVEDVADAIARALTSAAAAGRCYNLVGDVRLSAREYIAEVAAVLGRPLVYHPQSPVKLWAVEFGKWLIKRAVGRKAPAPTLYDLRSRGLVARFDTDDAKRDLGWAPQADRAAFLRAAIGARPAAASQPPPARPADALEAAQ